MTRPTARRVLPGFTERTSHGQRARAPYAKLMEERIVLLGTPIDETSANDAVAQFMYLEHQAPDRDIALYINSPGGSFEAMSAIYDTMRYVTCDVETTCLGRADSSAAILLAAGTPGKRSMLPGARAVIRQPALPGPVQGQTDDLTVRAEELTRVRTRMEEMLVRHTGRSRARVSADVERDRVLDAPGAVAYGLVDRIVTDREGSRPAPGPR